MAFKQWTEAFTTSMNNGQLKSKGDFLYYGNDIYYFDKDNGNPVTNQFINKDNSWYYFGADGKAVSGFQTINGQNLYFHEYGVQAKGQLVTIGGKTLLLRSKYR